MTLTHSRSSYPIRLCALGDVLADLPSGAFVVTDQNVQSLYKGLIAERPTYVLEPGESSKSIDCWKAVAEWLLSQRANRKSTLVALGGGVVGDLAGFVASSYMRGIPYIQIPTTLVAQVDSAIGGKVGIDLPGGKNLLGAFWHPTEVRVATEFLSTLPPREWIGGKGEVVKYGLIADPELTKRLSSKPFGPNDADVAKIIERCIQIKTQVVEADEFETKGLRSSLNFGHTVGHALEAYQGYAGLNHGEAVAVGMLVEARIGVLMGVTPQEACDATMGAVETQGLPTTNADLAQADALIDLMYRDKKSVGGLSMSLLTRVGECKLCQDVPRSLAEQALKPV